MALFLVGATISLYAQTPLQAVSRYNDWDEQEGYAIVLGSRLQYFLYNTYKHHNGDASDLWPGFFQWVERQGWIVDYDNTQIVDPNKELAKSVKMLMATRNCDVSVTIFENNRRTCLYINN